MADIHEIDQRIAKCEKILSANPGSQIFAALAEAHRKKGDLDRAFEVCQKGLKTHPNYGSAHLVMAKINLDKGLFDWAETEIEKASELGGNAHAIESMRCEILLHKGEKDEAIVRIKKLLMQDPANDQLKKLLESAESASKPLQPSFSPAPAPGFFGSASQGIIEPQVVTVPRKKLTGTEFLSECARIDGVMGGVHAGDDGTTLDAVWNGQSSAKELAASCIQLADQITPGLEKIQFGELESVFVESKNNSVYFLQAGVGHYAFLFAEGANVNRIRAGINRFYKDLADDAIAGAGAR